MMMATRILVVDDDLVTSRMLERMLRRRGFEVFTASVDITTTQESSESLQYGLSFTVGD